MKKSSTVFLQVVIMLIGIVALAIMIRFPLTEGRAINLDLFSIYSDPFIIYGYIAFIAFFIVLYQAFKLLGIYRAKQSILTKLCESFKDYKILRNYTKHLNCDGNAIHNDVSWR